MIIVDALFVLGAVVMCAWNTVKRDWLYVGMTGIFLVVSCYQFTANMAGYGG